jgi:hypothetical protein
MDSHKILFGLGPASMLSAILFMGSAPSALAQVGTIPNNIASSMFTARSLIVGTAASIKNCKEIHGTPDFSNLNIQYEDARSRFNGKIESWIFSLETTKRLPEGITDHEEGLGVAFRRIEVFNQSANEARRKWACPVAVGWPIAAGVIATISAPALAVWVQNFLESSRNETEEERQAYVRKLKELLIPRWESVGAIIAFDWKSQTLHIENAISEALFAGGGVDIYVNKAALVNPPNELFQSAEETTIPGILASSYYKFTGRPERLVFFLGTKPKLIEAQGKPQQKRPGEDG